MLKKSLSESESLSISMSLLEVGRELVVPPDKASDRRAFAQWLNQAFETLRLSRDAFAYETGVPIAMLDALMSDNRTTAIHTSVWLVVHELVIERLWLHTA